MTIITASAAAFWGRPLPAGVACVERDHRGERAVTYAELGREKRERQARRLAAKREVRAWRAVRLWVAYFDQSLMGGWHAFVEGLDLPRVWVDRDRRHWEETLTRLYPVTLFAGWEDWKEAFARAHRAGTQDRRPLGMAYLWHRAGELRRARPAAG